MHAGRGVAYILGGNIGGQLVTLMALPVIARMFTPSQFGYFSLVMAIVGVVAPVATLRFESAALLARDIDEARAVAWNAVLASIFVGAATGLVIHFLIFNDLAGLRKYPGAEFWAAALIILTSLFSTFTQLSLREQQYGLVAQRTFVRSLATAASQLGLGLVGRGSSGLLVGTAIGHCAGIVTMVRAIRDYLPFPGTAKLRQVWVTYWRFPALFAPSTLLNALGAQIPVIFVTVHFGLAAGGQLGIAERIVGLPVTVIGYSVSQVVQAEVASLLREERPGLQQMYLRITAVLTILGVAAGVGFGLLGPWLIPFVLGEQWSLAGEIVQVLALTSAVRLIATSLSNVLVLVQHAVANLALDVMRVLLVMGAIWLAIALDMGALSSLWILYSSLSITYVITWMVGLYATRSYDTEVLGNRAIP